MKLWTVITMFDVMVVAEDADDAKAAMVKLLHNFNPNEPDKMLRPEIVATEASKKHSIRRSWEKVSPLVSGGVPDDDYERIKGKTTVEIFQHIYTKRG